MADSEQVKAQGIDIVNEQGVAQVRIGAKLPNPVVGGVEMKREVAVGGIQLNDSQGNEIGGLGVIEGSRTGVFALDYTHHEAIALYATDSADGASTGLMMSEKVEFQDGKATRPYRRIEMRVVDGKPGLMMSGRDGKPRIVIGLDDNDNPFIKLIASDGKSRILTAVEDDKSSSCLL